MELLESPQNAADSPPQAEALESTGKARGKRWESTEMHPHSTEMHIGKAFESPTPHEYHGQLKLFGISSANGRWPASFSAGSQLCIGITLSLIPCMNSARLVEEVFGASWLLPEWALLAVRVCASRQNVVLSQNSPVQPCIPVSRLHASLWVPWCLTG